MESIPYLPDLGPPALAGIAVLLVLLGRLVPRRSVEDAKANAAHWRNAWELELHAHQQDSAQTAKLTETLDLHTHLLESIKESAEQSAAQENKP